MELQNQRPSWRSFEKVFTVSMWVKGLDGLVETVGGLLLLFSASSMVMTLARQLTSQELSEDPHDFIANFVLQAGHTLGEAHLFGSLYLISHGLLKIVLVVYLLKKDTRVYPWAIGFLLLFAVYQLYLTVQHHSVSFLVLTIIDVFIVFMAWQEYRRLSA